MDHSMYKDIKLGCDYEKDYPIPKMIRDDGTKRFAYVTLIMLGDLYVSAGIVMGYSLQRLNSKADRIALVTNDVSEEGKKVLKKVFDRVIPVEYIRMPNWRTKIQPNRLYLDYVFTKFHCMNLIEYDKVMLIDADAVMLKHPDHVFSLATPAGVLLEKKELFISCDREGNYIPPCNNKIEWYEKLCGCCGHGKKIPKEITDRVLKNKKNSGVAGGLMLIEPKMGELDRIMEDLGGSRAYNLVNKFFVWPEQQYLTQYYSGDWTSINPAFLGLQGYPHWRYLFGVQYAGDKPFMLRSKQKMSDRVKYSDFQLWHAMFDELLAKHEDLSRSPAIREALEMNAFIHQMAPDTLTLERQVFDKKHDMGKLIKVYGDMSKISKHIQELLHGRPDIRYKPVGFNTSLFEIKMGDYESLTKNLSEEFNTQFYKDLQNKVKNSSSKIHKLGLEQDMSDILAIMYTKCRLNSFGMFIWGMAAKYTDRLEDIIDADVYYRKELSLTKEQFRNLLFAIYCEYPVATCFSSIEKKMNYIKVGEQNKVSILLFDNIKMKKVSGAGAEYKTYLRDKLIEMIKADKQDTEGVWGNDLIHITDFFYQTVEMAGMVLNNNTIEMFGKQNIERHYSFLSGFAKLNTLRKILYTKFHPIVALSTVVIGSGILNMYGVRDNTDIDLQIADTPTVIQQLDKIGELFSEEKSKIPFIDGGVINSKYWRQSWTDGTEDIMRTLKIDSSLTEYILDPRNTINYLGIRFFKPELEIWRKLKRMNKSDIADIAMIGLKYRNITDMIKMDKNNKLILPDGVSKIQKHRLVQSIDKIKRSYGTALSFKDLQHLYAEYFQGSS